MKAATEGIGHKQIQFNIIYIMRNKVLPIQTALQHHHTGTPHPHDTVLLHLSKTTIHKHFTACHEATFS